MASTQPGERRADYAPTGTETGAGAGGTLKRTVTEFSEDNGTDWAAALTYYALLALFPALTAIVSLIGLVADPVTTTRELTEIGAAFNPAAAEALTGPIESISSNRSGAGIAFVVGVGGALWSASGYVRAITRPSNVIYETPEGRPVWKLKPLQILVTVLVVVLTVVLALSLVLTGPVVTTLAGPLGLSDSLVSIWNIAKWPVMALLVLLMVAVLYYATPNIRQPRFHWLSPRAPPWRSPCGWSPRSRSRSTWRTSARTTRRTARSAASSRSSSGCGSPTSRCCSVPS